MNPIEELTDIGETLCDIESQPGWREYPGLVAESERLRQRRQELRDKLLRAMVRERDELADGGRHYLDDPETAAEHGRLTKEVEELRKRIAELPKEPPASR